MWQTSFLRSSMSHNPKCFEPVKQRHSGSMTMTAPKSAKLSLPSWNFLSNTAATSRPSSRFIRLLPTAIMALREERSSVVRISTKLSSTAVKSLCFSSPGRAGRRLPRAPSTLNRNWHSKGGCVLHARSPLHSSFTQGDKMRFVDVKDLCC